MRRSCSRSTVVAISHLGLDQANVYLFGTRGVSPQRLVSQAGFVAALAGLAGGAIVLIGPWLAPEFFGDIRPAMLWMAALSIPVGIHAIYATGLLTLTGRVRTPLAAAAGGAAAFLASVLILEELGSLTPFTAYLSAVATNIGVWLVRAYWLASPRDWIGCEPPLLRESLAQSLVLHIGSAMLFLHLRVDMFLVKGMLGTAALGLYSLAVVLAESMMLATDSIALVLLPRLMSGSLQGAARRALTAARLAGLVAAAAAVAWVVCGRFVIVTVFGRAFEDCFVVLLVLIPGVGALGMQRMCGGVVLRVGRPWTITCVHMCSAFLNLAMNIFWIPRMGIAGAAMASTISYSFGAVAFLYWTASLGDERFSSAWKVRASDLRMILAPALRVLGCAARPVIS